MRLPASRRAKAPAMTTPAATSDIERAVFVLRSGGLVAFPTDTLYALGADAARAAAVDRVFAVKGREAGKALPLFVDGLEMAGAVCILNDAARRLAASFWPGALTLVLPRRPEFESLALGGGGTAALRVPAHATALALVAGLGGPVTGTSANRSGGPEPATAAEVRRQLGEAVDYVLDGGPCLVGRPSTVVDCSGDDVRVLRQGAIAEESIRRALAA